MGANVRLMLWRERVVVRKDFPATAEGRNRNDGQRRWLHEARDHPVVRIEDSAPFGSSICTNFAGSATALGPRPPVEAVVLLSAVASCLGRLHRCGLVHGNIAGDHIVVNGPMFALCSPNGKSDDPSEDVVAFGPMMDRLQAGWAERPSRSLDAALLSRWAEVRHRCDDRTLSADRLARMLLRLADEPRPRFTWPFRGLASDADNE